MQQPETTPVESRSEELIKKIENEQVRLGRCTSRDLPSSTAYACYLCQRPIKGDLYFLSEQGFLRSRATADFYPLDEKCYLSVIGRMQDSFAE